MKSSMSPSTPITPCFISFIQILLLITSSVAESHSCKSTCGSNSVQFPFGFTDGCQIQLNCSESHLITIGNFTVLNITSSSIFLDLPAICNRPTESISGLFGANFGPTWNNTFLFRSCPKSQPNSCYIPEDFVEKQLALENCRPINERISCFANERSDVNSEDVEFGYFIGNKCKFLFSSMAVSSDQNSPLSLMFETIELGWWVNKGNSSDCDENATWKSVKLGREKAPGTRCQCLEGFHGDGFRNGSGCRRDDDDDDDEKLGFYISTVFGFIVGFWIVCGTLVLKNSWRYAYFRFFDRIKKKIALTIAPIAREAPFKEET